TRLISISDVPARRSRRTAPQDIATTPSIHVRLVGSGAGAVTAWRSVSSPRPSNRACASLAPGSPTPFTGGVRFLPPGPVGPGCDDDAVEADQTQIVARAIDLGESPGAPTLVAFRVEHREPHHRVASDLIEGVGGVPVAEITRPAAQEQVDLLPDLLDRSSQPGPHRHQPDAVSGMLHRPACGPAGQEGDACAARDGPERGRLRGRGRPGISPADGESPGSPLPRPPRSAARSGSWPVSGATRVRPAARSTAPTRPPPAPSTGTSPTHRRRSEGRPRPPPATPGRAGAGRRCTSTD